MAKQGIPTSFPKAQLSGARIAQASPRRYSSSLEASTKACGAPGEPSRRKVDLSTSEMQIIAQENEIDNGNSRRRCQRRLVSHVQYLSSRARSHLRREREREREREIALSPFSQADEDGSVFMSGPFAEWL